MVVAGCSRAVAVLLLWVQATLLGGVVGQGRVQWQFGMFGVSEDSGFVELCAIYSEAVEGFAVETSTTEFAAFDGEDYLSQIGPESHLVWGPNTTKACINITIINDNIAENDEVFFVNMVRVVTSPDLTSPSLELTTVMIMDDDSIQLVFVDDVIIITDDVGSVEVCVAVADELVNDDVFFRIPIVVETVENGTARADYDYVDFNNMTVGSLSCGLLTITSHTHCFTISIPARPDNGLDDRNFFVSVEVRGKNENAEISPPVDRIAVPAPAEIIIQPSSQIEFGDIYDIVLSNPLFTVTLDLKGEESDSYLCYEISGDGGQSFNLVSDTCFSINAHYEVIDVSKDFNKIDQLFITAIDAAGECSSILIEASTDCEAALVFRGTQLQTILGRYRRNGVQIDVGESYVEILLPCEKYPGGGIKVVAKCNSEFQNPNNGSIYQVKNLNVEFYRGKLSDSIDYPPHGLVGQFWHPSFAMEQMTEVLANGQQRSNAFQVTQPEKLGAASFVAFQYFITWDRRYEMCLYAGSRQAGTTSYSPNAGVIQGVYTDYIVDRFTTDFPYSVFSHTDLNCPDIASRGAV